MPTPPPENRLLATLPSTELARLTAKMTDVTFGQKDLVYLAGSPLDAVYFPRSGVLSAVVVMTDGQVAEAFAVGNEGVMGVSAGFGAKRSTEQVFCQVPLAECRKMAADDFAAEAAKPGPFRDVVHNYTCGMLSVSARQTACNCLHSVDERCARWLLMCHDRVAAEEFSLTHEFLSTMLGVRRATVSVIAGSLQSAGLITYRHGRVKVIDRAGLEKAACECYAAIRGFLQRPIAKAARP